MIDFRNLDKKLDSGKTLSEEYRETLIARKSPLDVFEKVIELNKKRKELLVKSETAKAHQNKVSAEIPQMKKRGEDTTELLAQMGKLSAEVKTLESEASAMDERVLQEAMNLPNKIHASGPRGSDEAANETIKKVGTPKEYVYKTREHWDIAENLNIVDFERASKVTGSRFSFLIGMGARLERAIGQYFMDLHSNEHGYKEIIPPYIVNYQSYVGTGQFPKFLDDVFHLKGTDYSLISTAEVPVTNFYRDEILEDEMLPAKFCALSPCFRSEAGSAGRDTKGLIRQHQFHKVELVTFAHPEKSYEILEELTTHAETCLTQLELPYKRVALCSGDIGFGAAKTYDLEVWLPGAKAYREISSCSNFEDFQARRANIRYRPKGGKPAFVHTLNGSGLAVGRTLVAILENYQQEDGSVKIPWVLQKYMGGAESIRARSAQ